MNFKWKGVHHRYALDRVLIPRKVRAKTEAEHEAENIRTAIREGTFRAPGQVDDPPVRETLTLSQLLALYRKRCLLPRLFPGGEVLTDPGAARERELLSKADSQIRIISRTELDRPDGERRAMGAWLVCDVTTDTIEQFQAVRSVKTWVAANRDLGLLRAMFNWAVRKKLVTETPFKIGTEPVIKLRKERARRRRLQPGEGD